MRGQHRGPAPTPVSSSAITTVDELVPSGDLP
jgi:hypothetical protein